MKKEVFYDLLKSIPKAELHVHEEAVISRDTVKKVYERNFGTPMSDEEFNSLFDYTDLGGFLTSFIKIQSYFKNISDLEIQFRDFEAYLNDNNIVYCETFISPTSHLKKGWQFNDIMNTISKCIKRISSNSHRTVRCLIDVSRSFGMENAMNNLNYVIAARNPLILGIGLGGDEAKGPAKEYAPVFDKAVEHGLHTVTHAGESVESWSMKDSINLCHAERLGHGIQAIKDPEFVKELAEKQVPLEVCPTSNIFILQEFKGDMKNHPAKKLYDAGCNITINTDDPTFFKCSLIDEYWNIYSELGFTLEYIKNIIKNGFTNSFMAKKMKTQWCNKVDEAWFKWFQAHPEEKE